jgi:hypothetical protein
LTNCVKTVYTESTLKISVEERKVKEQLDRVIALEAKANEEDVKLLVKKLKNAKSQLKDISVKSLEEVAKYFKEEARLLKTKELLDWMNENDQVSFETDKHKADIKTYVSSKIEDEEKAFKWLTSHDYGDLIKDNLAFPKGELTKEIEKTFEEMGLSYTKKSNIHPQTLKKVMSDRLEGGEELPDEEAGFKINYYDLVQVKGK